MEILPLCWRESHQFVANLRLSLCWAYLFSFPVELSQRQRWKSYFLAKREFIWAKLIFLIISWRTNKTFSRFFKIFFLRTLTTFRIRFCWFTNFESYSYIDFALVGDNLRALLKIHANWQLLSSQQRAAIFWKVENLALWE